MKEAKKAYQDFKQLLVPPGYKVLETRDQGIDLTITIESRKDQDVCPYCGKPSKKISRVYQRKVQAGSFNGKQVFYQVNSKLFECDNPGCSRQSFGESHPFVTKFQRRTHELEEEILSLVAFGGFSGSSRVLDNSGVSVSSSSVRRLASRVDTEVDKEAVTRIGIDEIAKHKGQSYCTLIYNEENGELVEKVDSKEGEDVAQALSGFKNLEFAARDHSPTFKGALNQSCPDCVQVADRFHTCKNFTETVSRELKKTLPNRIAIREGRVLSNNEFLKIKRRTKINLVKMSTNKKIQLYLDLKSYFRKDLKALSKTDFKKLSSVFGVSKAQLQPLQKFIDNHFTTDQEVRQLEESSKVDLSKYLNCTFVDKRELVYYATSKNKGGCEEIEKYLDQIKQTFPIFAQVLEMVKEFDEMIMGDDPQKLDDFIETYKDTWLKVFVNGLVQDYEATKNSIRYSLSSGFVEGNNNKIKLLKRMGYGRYGLRNLQIVFLLSKRMSKPGNTVILNPICEKI